MHGIIGHGMLLPSEKEAVHGRIKKRNLPRSFKDDGTG